MTPHPSPRSPLAAGMIIAGKYRLLRRLGSGAMGVVWAAVNDATGREVALKIIFAQRESVRLRVQREARACGAVRHPNVVDIYDVVQTDEGDPVLVLQLLQGETLADLLLRRRRLEPRLAAHIAREIAAALTAIHGAGVVHRDLKPANIFLHSDPSGARPAVKVLDFGVSKRIDVEGNPCTAPGVAVGSLHYMSPEQVRTCPDVDPGADLWALGVMLFEMLTGERPFRGGFSEVAIQIVQGGSPRVCRLVRRVDPVLVELVAGLMRRDRALRIGPAERVKRELDQIVGGADPWCAPPPSGPITARSAVQGAAFEDERSAPTRIMPALFAIDARWTGASSAGAPPPLAPPDAALPSDAPTEPALPSVAPTEPAASPSVVPTQPGFGDPGRGWIRPEERGGAASLPREPLPPEASTSRATVTPLAWPTPLTTESRAGVAETSLGWRAPSAAPALPPEARLRSVAHLAALSALLVLGAASVVVSAMAPPARVDVAHAEPPDPPRQCAQHPAPPPLAAPPPAPPPPERDTLDAVVGPPPPAAPDAELPAPGAESPSVRCVDTQPLDRRRCAEKP